MEKIVLILLSWVTLTRGEFLVKPQNVVVKHGSDVSFNCQGEPSDFGLTWSRSFKENAINLDDINFGTVVITLDNRYSMEYDQNLKKSTLKIRNVVVGDEAHIRCELVYRPSVFTWVQLIVIEYDPTCTTDVPVDRIIEGTTLKINCSMKYHSRIAWYPQMVATVSDGTILTSKIDSTVVVVQTTFDDTVTRSRQGMTYEVITELPAFDSSVLPQAINAADHATNVPTYKHTFQSGKINVLYPVSKITFSEEKDKYCAGENITCTSDGNPEATITWRDSYGQSVISDSILTITSNMTGSQNWTCEATNTVGGKTYSQQRSLEFDVSTLRCNGCQKTAIDTLVVSLGLIAILIHLFLQ